MPEGPEVETYRARLEPRLVGRKLSRVRIHDPRLTMPLEPVEVEAELEGERVASVERRGKYIVVSFESGLALVVHLRMTGGFPESPASHERATIDLDDGTGVSYRDVRRFGTWHVLAPPELDEYLGTRLGPEPLGPRFTVASSPSASRGGGLRSRRCCSTSASSRASGTSTPTRRSGMRGSIRCDRRPSSSRRKSRLCGGACGWRSGAASSARARISATGAYPQGSMQDEFRVYGRTGEPCLRCRGPIEKIRVAGRGTHYCPVCQR